MPEDNPYLAHRNKKPEKERYNDDNFDTSLIHRKRSRMHLKMNKPGKYIQIAKKEKLMQRIEQRQASVQIKAKEEEDFIRQHWSRVPLPQIEWWDAVLLYPCESYDQLDPLSLFDTAVPQLATVEEPKGTIPVTHLILHPLLPSPDGKPVKIPIYLTKPEIKRMRRLRRLDEQREKQDQILLGEIVEEPKLTLDNFTKVLSPEILQDPTKAEQMVLDQIEERKEKHLQHNQLNKKTREEKNEKIIQKWQKDRRQGLFRVVYKINKMNFQIKNKIDLNAKQLHMTGVLIWYKHESEEYCLFVVEGGRIAVNKINSLLIRRINWKDMVADKAENDMDVDNDSADEDMDIVDENEYFQLRWKGLVKKSIFADKIGTFRVKMCDEKSIQPYLEYIGEEMESYWKLLK